MRKKEQEEEEQEEQEGCEDGVMLRRRKSRWCEEGVRSAEKEEEK